MNKLFSSKAAEFLRSKAEAKKKTPEINFLTFESAETIADMVISEEKSLYCPKEGIYIANYNVDGLVRACICSDDTINEELVTSQEKGNWDLHGQIFCREDLIKWLNTNNYIDPVSFPPRYKELWVDSDDLYDESGNPITTVTELKEQIENL